MKRKKVSDKRDGMNPKKGFRENSAVEAEKPEKTGRALSPDPQRKMDPRRSDGT